MRQLQNQTSQQDTRDRQLRELVKTQDTLLHNLQSQILQQNLHLSHWTNQTRDQGQTVAEVKVNSHHQDVSIEKLLNKTDEQYFLLQALQNETACQDGVSSLENDVLQQNSLIANLSTLVISQNVTLDQLQSRLTAQDHLITNVSNSLQSSINGVMSRVAASGHIEGGLIDCSLPPDQTDKTVTHWFARVYDSAPRVVWSVSSVRFYDSTYNNDYKDVTVELISLNSYKFIIKCQTSSYSVTPLSVAWVSFPK